MTKFLIYQGKTEVFPPDATMPSFRWFGALSEPRKAVVAFAALAASGAILPPQPTQAAPVAPAFGWYAPLAQTLFKAQVVRSFTGQFGYQFFYGVPAAPPAAPAMAFFRPLSEPVFAQVKYPSTRVLFPSWAFLPVTVTDPWTPVVPGSNTWTPQTTSSDPWTPQIPGTTTWIPQ